MYFVYSYEVHFKPEVREQKKNIIGRFELKINHILLLFHIATMQ